NANLASFLRVVIATYSCRCRIVFVIAVLSSSPGTNPGCQCAASQLKRRAYEDPGALRRWNRRRHSAASLPRSSCDGRYCDARRESWANPGITQGKPWNQRVSGIRGSGRGSAVDLATLEICGCAGARAESSVATTPRVEKIRPHLETI